ncbi:transmembrane protein 33-like [Corticium candelabrum]|uniref:transmembrane protein 33-like n=1 Tax=Corticium candelabrum TaxID=121492 RepID=UPI002E258075|nr:transmembrane protein 33-like [Corticium candelabrum]
MLIPVSLFSVLHVTNFLKSVCQHFPPSIADRVNKISQILDANSVQIYRIIAFAEVVTFPVILVSVFIGIEPLLIPIMHYQFLVLRYRSRRFPYTRFMFAELRVFIEQIAARPTCPSFIRQFLTGFIKLVSRLAPAAEYSMPERP